MFLIPTTVTGFTSEASISIGTNSTTFNNLFVNTALTGLNAVTKFWQLNNSSGLSILNVASDIIKLKVNTAGVGTTFTFKALIFGYYI